MPLLWKPVVREEDRRRRGPHTKRLIVKNRIPNEDMLKTGSLHDKVGLYKNQLIGHLSYGVVVSNPTNLQKVNPWDSTTLLEHLSPLARLVPSNGAGHPLPSLPLIPSTHLQLLSYAGSSANFIMSKHISLSVVMMPFAINFICTLHNHIHESNTLKCLVYVGFPDISWTRQVTITTLIKSNSFLIDFLALKHKFFGVIFPPLKNCRVTPRHIGLPITHFNTWLWPAGKLDMNFCRKSLALSHPFDIFSHIVWLFSAQLKLTSFQRCIKESLKSEL